MSMPGKRSQKVAQKNRLQVHNTAVAQKQAVHHRIIVEADQCTSLLPHRLGHNQAGGSGQLLALQCFPSSLLEPASHLYFAVHIPFAGEHLEFTGHQSGKGGLGMCWISPEVD